MGGGGAYLISSVKWRNVVTLIVLNGKIYDMQYLTTHASMLSLNCLKFSVRFWGKFNKFLVSYESYGYCISKNKNLTSTCHSELNKREC